jgi:hypothetical protein
MAASGASATVEKNRLLRGAIVAGVCLVLWILPPVGPLQPQAMHLVAIFVAMVFLVTLALWASGEWTGLNATAIALVGVAFLMVSNVLTWDDVLGERGA